MRGPENLFPAGFFTGFFKILEKAGKTGRKNFRFLYAQFLQEKYFTIYFPPRTERFTHMTARLIDPESRRRPVGAAVALVLVACVFVAIPVMGGAMTETTDEGTLLFTNESFWIRWDPVGDHVTGDHFFVNGSTNLSPGSIIRYVFYTPVSCHKKYCDYSDSIRDGNTTIGPGEIPGTNRFSVRINTTGLKTTTGQGSEQYFLTFRVFLPEKSPEPDAFSGFDYFVTRRSSLFSESILDSIESGGLSQYREPGRYYWIALDYDTVSDVHHYSIPCDQINGMTNLPAGENLYYSAFPYDDYREIDRRLSNRTFGGTVVPGKIPGINAFVIPLNTSGFSDVRYIVIWNPRYNVSDRAGSISTTVIFGRPVSDNSETCPPILSGSGTDERNESASANSTASSSAFFIVCIAVICGAAVMKFRKMK